MKLQQLCLPPTGLALLSLASLSSATDYKVYPGAGCQPRTGSQAASFRTDVTGMTNTSTQNRFVTCPLERDRIPAPEGLDPGVRVASANGARLTCWFYSLDQNGGILQRVARSTTASAPTPLVFSGGAILTEAAGSYAFRCLLPPQGQVINYSNGEAGETGNAELP